MTKIRNEWRTAELREQLGALRARYDWGAVSPAVYAAIKSIETDVAWREHDRYEPSWREHAR